MTGVEELREHYDTADQSAALAEATREDGVDDEALVSTSIRLSKATLDKVRSRARASGVPATTLMREWIEAQVNGDESLVVSVADLERLIAARAHRSS